MSDSETEAGSDEEDTERGPGGPGGAAGGAGGAAHGADDAMGKRRGGELGVNKKGTPLYSREDIREQYCINDKELQVLDKSGRKGLFGCFSNQGQVRTFTKKVGPQCKVPATLKHQLSSNH